MHAWCVYVMHVCDVATHVCHGCDGTRVYLMAVMVAWQIAKAKYLLVGSSILAASLYNFYKSLAAMLAMSWL